MTISNLTGFTAVARFLSQDNVHLRSIYIYLLNVLKAHFPSLHDRTRW